ncbi:MAG TPA: flagellar hook capping FlgD N-terminal domain-containing protein [Stellaceae bacterium]|nr:flagellar hook capping FlgD N-terminal domain-containing protein [Stellaceae bacterium]
MSLVSTMPPTVTTLPQGTQIPSAAASNTTLTQNNFLQLLTAQLQHQDPLNPLSPSDFAAQLAQFSTATGVQSLNTTMNAAGGIQAAGLVGHNVAVAGNTLVLGSGGAATGAFSLSGAAKDVQVTVSNSSGNLVAVLDLGSMAAGSQTFTWNGQSIAGTTLPAGNYSFAVAPTSAGSTAVSATPYSVVPVTAVVLNAQNGPTLNLGDGAAPVALSAVQQVF